MAALMGNQEKEANELMIQAEKALKRFSLFSRSAKFEDAIEFYKKAANKYKISQKWQEAGDAYAKCAECERQIKSEHEAATSYVAAADMYKRIEPANSIEYYRHAITIFSDLGRFTSAAKHAETIAGLYSSDGNDEVALEYYQQAANFFAGEDATTRAGKCLDKVARLSAQMGKYDPAYETFEKQGIQSLDSNLLKFNAKKHFFHAGLCLLAKSDDVALEQAIEKYSDRDTSFGDSRECKLLVDINEAFRNQDVDTYADVLYSYDSVGKLDPWETSILLRIKNAMQDSGVDGEPDLG